MREEQTAKELREVIRYAQVAIEELRRDAPAAALAALVVTETFLDSAVIRTQTLRGEKATEEHDPGACDFCQTIARDEEAKKT